MPATNSIAAMLASRFPHEATQGQSHFFHEMEGFLDKEKWHSQAFILKGYAGTGKTSLIAAIIQVLPRLNYKSVLLAPTGRAAKVMSNYAQKRAYTIHKKIYKQVANPYTGNVEFILKPNTNSHTVYLVDEASMISDAFSENDFFI